MGKSKQFELLHRETKFVSYAESLSSTQDYLHKHWRELPQFSVSIADFQERGRGRFMRNWEAPKATSLLISVLVPLSSRRNYGWVALAGALAAREACAQLVPTAQIFIKWPNDLVDANGQKTGGVLGEVLGERDGELYGAIGVGINITQKEDELLATATSLARICANSFESFEFESFESAQDTLAATFVRELKVYLTLDKAKLVAELKRNCIDIGQIRTYRVGERQVAGLVRGVDSDGALIVGDWVLTHDEIARAALNEAEGMNGMMKGSANEATDC